MLEIIAFDLAGALAAQKAGAQRIELCADPALGGTTPARQLIEAAVQQLDIPVYVMVRPRGGNFVYSDAEFEAMEDTINFCKSVGCQGVVFGILTPSANVDQERCARLRSLAMPMEATFHRAFDEVADPLTALEQIIELKFERILTSGQAPTAPQGAALIRKCVEQANGRIIIMPGSGVTATTLPLLHAQTHASEFHSSAKRIDAQGNYLGVDTDEVKLMAALLRKLAR